MSWQKEVDEIERRRKRALEHGGSEAVEKQHARGRLTVRERLDALVDRDSFREHGRVAGASTPGEDDFTPANTIVGTAEIDGRRVVVGGDDFTQSGGAYSTAGLKKGLYADELAIKRRLPLVRLLEAGGASIAGTGGGARGRSGYDMTAPPMLNVLCMDALASVPVVCAALGPVAGYPAGRLASAHFSLMTKETAQVLTGGPALVERAIGEQTTKEDLGSAKVHGRSGVVDNVVEDEEDAFRQIRKFLSYMPPNAWSAPPRFDVGDVRERCEQRLLDIVPRERRRAYKMRRLIELIVDGRSFFEMTPGFGRAQITGLARVDGRPVGVLANDCMFDGGSMTAEGAQKIRRFVELCDNFHLPIVSLVDEPGFMIGTEAEKAATIRHGMSAMFAVLQSQTPWFAIVVRRAFGVAQGIHYGNGGTVVAWPSAASGALPVEGGVQLAYGREIAAAEDPETRRRELEDEMEKAQSILPRAEEFGVHDLIDPRETRPRICDWLDEIEEQVALQVAEGPRRYTLRP